MIDLPLVKRVVERMGYENMAAAESHELDGLLFEFGLIPPGFDGNWNFVVHEDCDPDRADQGTSGVEPAGSTFEEAAAYYTARVEEFLATSPKVQPRLG